MLDTQVNAVLFAFTYAPNPVTMPDEERIAYAEVVTVDAVAIGGENRTPPSLIRDMITNFSPYGEYIDHASFDRGHVRYDASRYYLNGVMDSHARLHDALRLIFKNGMCRLDYSMGKIRFIGYHDEDDPKIDFAVYDPVLRSRVISEQPISTLKNSITVYSSKDLSQENAVYKSSVLLEDAESIARYERQELVLQMTLIYDDNVARLIADRKLRMMKQPSIVYRFEVLLDVGFFMQKCDRALLRHFVDPNLLVEGVVMAISRRYGQGKNGTINKFTVDMLATGTALDIRYSDIVGASEQQTALIEWSDPEKVFAAATEEKE
jgi:hypothetical protein